MHCATDWSLNTKLARLWRPKSSSFSNSQRKSKAWIIIHEHCHSKVKYFIDFLHVSIGPKFLSNPLECCISCFSASELWFVCCGFSRKLIMGIWKNYWAYLRNMKKILKTLVNQIKNEIGSIIVQFIRQDSDHNW